MKELVAVDASVRAALPSARELSAADILRCPGMLGTDAFDLDRLRTVCRELLEEALQDFTPTRACDGEKLKIGLLELVARSNMTRQDRPLLRIARI